jgi:hypothetical protein
VEFVDIRDDVAKVLRRAARLEQCHPTGRTAQARRRALKQRGFRVVQVKHLACRGNLSRRLPDQPVVNIDKIPTL